MVISNERSVITIVLRNPLVVVAVILESCSPGSVVIKLGLDSGTLRARSSWAAKTLRGFLLMSFPNVVVGNLSLLLLFSSEKANPRRTLRAAKTLGDDVCFCFLLVVIPKPCAPTTKCFPPKSHRKQAYLHADFPKCYNIFNTPQICI